MNLHWILFMLLFARSSYAADRLMVPMTLVNDTEALCLDGSAPMYHFDKGSGSGARNWVLTFEGGGWCNDLKSCLQRSKDRHGSTTLMNKYAIFSGILSNDPTKNPDFYNWNRVKLRYCDGGSFAGDAIYENGTTKLYFKGQKIWDAIIRDLLPKGLNNADKGLLAGSSAGGLSTFFHCDNFASVLPKIATVKCLSDAGFFVDIKDILSNDTARVFYENLMDVQGIEKNLNKKCTSSLPNPKQCFFPQYVLPYINTPYFILNVAYDTYQIRHHLVPPNTDLHGKWNHCKQDPTTCTPDQLKILQGLRDEMVKALEPFRKSSKGGMFITSCFGHGQSELQGTWFAPGAPKMNNKQIATVVGDWYFERGVAMEVGLPYPSDTDCHNEVL